MCEASPLHRLQRLSLASCRLGDGGVRRLCDQLRHCALLSALDLSHNAIGPLGTAHVAKLLVLEPAAANGADGGDRGGDGSVGEGDDDGDSVEAMDVEQPLLAMEVESTGVMNEMEPRLTGEEANSRSSCSDCGGVGMSVDVPSRPADTQAPIRLVYLDLSCNPLGAGGVECISLALQTNSCLRHLAMRYVNANPPEGDARCVCPIEAVGVCPIEEVGVWRVAGAVTLSSAGSLLPPADSSLHRCCRSFAPPR